MTTSYGSPRFTPAFPAAEDLTAAKGFGVKMNGSGKIVAATVAGERVLGLLQNEVDTDQTCEIAAVGGGAYAVAGGTVAEFAELMVAVGGKLITATTGKQVVAIALEAAVADGSLAVEVANYIKA